jgi:hypothetical protein
MPFESGSTALTIFKMPKSLPENYLELFAARNAGMLDHVKDEQSIGWVARHLLETTIDDNTAICGGHVHLAMRIAQRKIPTSLLKAICHRDELAYMQANDSISVPSKIRKQIKEEAMDKHLMKMPPSISAIPMVIDRAANMLYVGSSSNSQIDTFLAFFLKTLDLDPIQVTCEEMLFEMFQKDADVLPSITITENPDDDEAVPARDFLTWLWYYSEQQGGAITVEKYGNFELMIEGPLTFAFAAEAKGAAETTVKKGSPLRSAEAKAALNVGKKLKKAKLTLARDQQIWSGSFDADKFAFSGLSLPEGETTERHDRFAERVEFLHIFYHAMREYFRKFASELMADDWQEKEKDIQRWARERDSY